MTDRTIAVDIPLACFRELENVSTLDELVAWAEAVRNSVPEEYREIAVIECDNDYDDGWSMSGSYRRPETEGERAFKVLPPQYSTTKQLTSAASPTPIPRDGDIWIQPPPWNVPFPTSPIDGDLHYFERSICSYSAREKVWITIKEFSLDDHLFSIVRVYLNGRWHISKYLTGTRG